MYQSRPEGNALALSPGAKQTSVAGLLYLEPVQAPTAGTSVRLADLWHLLLQGWRWIAASGAVGLVAALAIALWQEPAFQSKTQIDIQPMSDGSGDGSRIQAGFSADSYLHTQERILQSKTLRSAVLERLKKENRQWFSNTEGGFLGWRNRLMSKAGHRKLMADGLPKVSAQVRILDNSRIIEITATSPDPAFAAVFANTMVEEYVESQLSGAWNASQRNLQWMTRQLDNLKQKLEDSQQSLQQTGRKSGIIIGFDNSAELAEMQDQLSKAQADRMMAQSMLEVANSSRAGDLPQVISNQQLSGYQTRLADLRRQLAQLKVQFTPAYYKVTEVEAQINELERALKGEQDSILHGIRNEYLAAARREQLLKSAYLSQQRQLSERSEKSAEYDIQKREVESLRGLYDELLKKVQSGAVASASRADWVRVIDPAVPADGPSKPNLPKYSVMGWLSCTLACAVLVVGRGYARGNLAFPGETTKHVGAPELGVIPAVELMPKKTTSGPGRLMIEDGKQTINGSDLMEWEDRPSVAEAYRSTIASLIGQKNRSGNKGRQVIMTTSPNRGDGKSTSTVNLGIALTETGRSVVVIDADMRKPRLHQILQTPNNWGLSNILSERIPLADLPLKSLVRDTPMKGLSLVSSGPGIANVSQLLYSERLEELLDRLRQEFDFVLIDTPPMLPVTDARIIGRVADGAILVVRSGKTAIEAVVGAKELLEQDGIPLFGTLLNAWDIRTSRNAYGYYYETVGPAYGN